MKTTDGTITEWGEFNVSDNTGTFITYGDVKRVPHDNKHGVIRKPLNKREYEEDLARRQREHLEGLENKNWQPCMHDGCPECVGTGIKKGGGTCIHMISCPCPKCTPYC